MLSRTCATAKRVAQGLDSALFISLPCHFTTTLHMHSGKEGRYMLNVLFSPFIGSQAGEDIRAGLRPQQPAVQRCQPH